MSALPHSYPDLAAADRKPRTTSTPTRRRAYDRWVRDPEAVASGRSGRRSLGVRVTVVAVGPGRCVRQHGNGGGLMAVADLYRQLGDRRDLGYLERRSARDLGLGRSHVVIAEVRE